MEQWYQDNRSYANAPPCQTALLGKYFSTSCTGVPSASDYTLNATALTGSGVEGASFTLNRAGERATLGMPSGWTVPTQRCWGSDRGGNCQ
jgi:type IV pilus assembly protein PilE